MLAYTSIGRCRGARRGVGRVGHPRRLPCCLWLFRSPLDLVPRCPGLGKMLPCCCLSFVKCARLRVGRSGCFRLSAFYPPFPPSALFRSSVAPVVQSVWCVVLFGLVPWFAVCAGLVAGCPSGALCSACGAWFVLGSSWAALCCFHGLARLAGVRGLHGPPVPPRLRPLTTAGGGAGCPRWLWASVVAPSFRCPSQRDASC